MGSLASPSSTETSAGWAVGRGRPAQLLPDRGSVRSALLCIRQWHGVPVSSTQYRELYFLLSVLFFLVLPGGPSKVYVVDCGIASSAGPWSDVDCPALTCPAHCQGDYTSRQDRSLGSS